MTSGYSTRWFRDEDLDQFLETFEKVFGYQMTREYFRWKYVENPYIKGNTPVIVAEDSRTGVAVGFRGCVPTRHRAREDFNTMYSGDVMVHPDHRRRGINTLMIEHALTNFQDYRFQIY